MRSFSYYSLLLTALLPLVIAQADSGKPCPDPSSSKVLGVPETNAHVMDPLNKSLDRVVNSDEREHANLEVASSYFQSKGFKCNSVSPLKGLICIGRIEGYPKDVALIVPPGFHAEDQADLILQLHGHNDAPKESLADKISHLKYAESLAATHRNAIMVAPYSDGNCVDFEKNLSERAQFEGFMNQVASLAKGASLAQTNLVGPIALTSHSGGYRTLAAIVKNGGFPERVREVYLLDSAYGRVEEFSGWAAEPYHRFWSVYHVDDTAQEKVAEALKRNLLYSGASLYDGKTSEITPKEVRATRIGLVPTRYWSAGPNDPIRVVGHDATFIEYYAKLLGVQ